MFEHRKSYDASAVAGRDHCVVLLLEQWIPTVLRGVLREASGVTVLDVGCGAQPFRALIESLGARYLGMDVVQNSGASVDIVAAIDAALPDPWPQPERQYAVVLCTEVMEHTLDWSLAFRNLRALLATDGRLILTTPFMFPIHMEPYDYFRATPHALLQLARIHGFLVERHDVLGHPFDVLWTLLSDTSILPAHRTLASRSKTVGLRLAKQFVLRLLENRWLRTGVTVNANSHLSNAMVLRSA